MTTVTDEVYELVNDADMVLKTPRVVSVAAVDSVNVLVLSPVTDGTVNVAVAMLLLASVAVIVAEPDVALLGIVTHATNAPEVLLLTVVGVVVMIDVLEPCVKVITMLAEFAKPVPVTWTLVPAAPDVLLSVIAGAPTVNVTAGALCPLKSVTVTVCAPVVAVTGTVNVALMLPVASVLVVLVVSVPYPLSVAVKVVLAEKPPPVRVTETVFSADDALREAPGVATSEVDAE
jgi:hypothetical protein